MSYKFTTGFKKNFLNTEKVVIDGDGNIIGTIKEKRSKITNNQYTLVGSDGRIIGCIIEENVNNRARITFRERNHTVGNIETSWNGLFDTTRLDMHGWCISVDKKGVIYSIWVHGRFVGDVKYLQKEDGSFYWVSKTELDEFKTLCCLCLIFIEWLSEHLTERDRL